MWLYSTRPRQPTDTSFCEPDGLRTVSRLSVEKFFVPPDHKLPLEMVCGLSADSLKFVSTDIRRWSANRLVPLWVLTFRRKLMDADILHFQGNPKNNNRRLGFNSKVPSFFTHGDIFPLSISLGIIYCPAKPKKGISRFFQKWDNWPKWLLSISYIIVPSKIGLS